MIKTGIIGNKAEGIALEYLRLKHLSLKQKNFRSRFGEIDLVMSDGDYLVFVEVRHRRMSSFGGAIESVDSHKQRKLRITAETYMLQNKVKDQPCRFDILCVNGKLNAPSIEWIKDAF